jgi:serine/threonine protein phosphatase PrpC/LysM repeat protein
MNSNPELQIQYASHSIAGKEKKFNTDICEKFDLIGGIGVVICDGIDGINNEGGALAAKLAVEGIKRHFRKNPVRNPIKALQGAMMLANFLVYDHAMKNERFSQMGVSILVVLIVDGLVYYASVGTNILALQREGVLYQLVKLDSDSPSPVSLLGREKNARFSMCKNPVQAIAGDVVLCATDGLNTGFSDEQIAELLSQEDISVDVLSYQIIYKIEELQIPDNATVGITRLTDSSELPKVGSPVEVEKEIIPAPEHANPMKNKRFVLIFILVLVVTVGLVVSKYLFVDDGVSNEDSLVKKKTERIQPEESNKSSKDSEATAKKTTKGEDKPNEANRSDDNDKFQLMDYTVQKGDNFYRLSLRFNVPSSRLEKVNKMTSAQLRFGQKIKIPVKAIHTVKTGESLASIAGDYHISKNDLLKVNQLKNENQLKVGFKIIVPLAAQ